MIDTFVCDDYDDETEVARAECFVWEDMSNFRGRREQFRFIFGLKAKAKEVYKIVQTAELLLIRELIQKLQERSNALLQSLKIPGDICLHEDQ